jgi:hypothetical protein
MRNEWETEFGSDCRPRPVVLSGKILKRGTDVGLGLLDELGLMKESPVRLGRWIGPGSHG